MSGHFKNASVNNIYKESFTTTPLFKRQQEEYKLIRPIVNSKAKEIYNFNLSEV